MFFSPAAACLPRVWPLCSSLLRSLGHAALFASQLCIYSQLVLVRPLRRQILIAGLSVGLTASCVETRWRNPASSQSVSGIHHVYYSETPPLVLHISIEASRYLLLNMRMILLIMKMPSTIRKSSICQCHVLPQCGLRCPRCGCWLINLTCLRFEWSPECESARRRNEAGSNGRPFSRSSRVL